MKAENVGICLFCSSTAFLSNEVYLLTDRASELCWCREVSPPRHPDFHNPPHTDAFLVQRRSNQCTNTHLHSCLPGIALSCSNLKSQEYLLMCSSRSLALSAFIAGLCIWNLKNARLRVQSRNSVVERWAEVKYQLWYYFQRSFILYFMRRKKRVSIFKQHSSHKLSHLPFPKPLFWDSSHTHERQRNPLDQNTGVSLSLISV